MVSSNVLVEKRMWFQLMCWSESNGFEATCSSENTGKEVSAGWETKVLSYVLVGEKLSASLKEWY